MDVPEVPVRVLVVPLGMRTSIIVDGEMPSAELRDAVLLDELVLLPC
jgi:hypothetical protein